MYIYYYDKYDCNDFLILSIKYMSAFTELQQNGKILKKTHFASLD